MKYIIDLRLSMDVLDDVEAREKALEVRQDLARYVESPDAEFKLQKLVDGQKPVGIVL